MNQISAVGKKRRIALRVRFRDNAYVKKVIAFLSASVLLLQSGSVFAEADPADRVTVSAGRENPELAAKCREKLGLSEGEIPPNGAPLANFRRCMVDEQNRIDHLKLVEKQNARNAMRLEQKQSRRSVKITAQTVQRSIRENIIRRQHLMRGVKGSLDQMQLEWLRQDKTSRRLQMRATEKLTVTGSLRKAIRLTCTGILPMEREECIKEQIELFNKVQGK